MRNRRGMVLFGLLLCGSVHTVVLAAKPVETQAASKRFTLNIPAQPLREALNELARQTGLQLIVRDEDVPTGINAPSLVGELSVPAALQRMLGATGLDYGYLNDHTIAIRATKKTGGTAGPGTSTESMESQRVQLAQTASGTGNTGAAAAANPDRDSKAQVQVVVVTGTNIRGLAPDSSPLTVYTKEDIERTGAASVEQFLRTVPQNFAANDRSTAQRISPNENGVPNNFSGATVDLHGLGNQATLVLLNGHRLAPAGDGQFSDVSLLPLAAIDRIEILTDGASAIYGTDAIAGVVNFVLKNDFDGAETSLRYGLATRGGDRETTASQLLGHHWSSGHFVMTGQYQNEGGLLSTQRDFIPPQGFPVLILPEQRMYNFLVTGSQELPWDIGLSGHAFYNHRRTHNNGDQDPTAAVQETDSFSRVEQYGANLDLHRDLGGDWRVTLQPAFARTIQQLGTDTPIQDFHSDFDITYQVASADAKVDGSLAALPAGSLKLAGGAAFRRESLREEIAYNGGTPLSDPTFHLDRNIDSAYAELFAPIVGSTNTLPFVRRLELSAAVRYDRYQGIGSTVNPKYGALWSPYEGLLVRATYGTSFRAPALQTRAQRPFYYVLPLNDPTSTSGTTNTLFEGYVTNKSVEPEKSRSFTVGLEWRPPALPVNSSVSYFHTEYRGRITITPIPNGGDFSQILPNEALLGPYIVRNPDPKVVAAAFADPNFIGDFSTGVHGPAGVGALFYYGDTNVASSVNSGIDASASYRFQLGAGDANISVFSTYLIENTFVPVKNGPQLEVLNDVGEPVGLRIGSNFTWSRAWFSGNLAIRHVDSYKNSVSIPPSSISPWTTLDLQLALDLRKMTGSATLRGLSASLAIRNLADQKPAFARPPIGTGYLYQSVNYDSANADALGRVISLQFKKSWGTR